ncbi:hypothetical protein BGZ51_008096 [Haplosporangium sp. Z 767]|nr:hypothetical protein BGZ51_008096 [Haplosporangium sp. Z 767]KAF9178363.1 hypothetical protein BGZ50_007772 [Haplosporangium sp. Z 11]
MHPPTMKLLFGLATLASVAIADITFTVIGYPSSASGVFGVSIGGTIHKLSTNQDIFPAWSGTVPGTDGNVEYSYVELSSTGSVVKAESFTRKLQDPVKDVKTLNEFFERPVTIWDLPKVPYTYPATYPSKTEAFKPREIATIHVTLPETEITAMNAKPSSSIEYKVDFRFINSEIIHSQRNITFTHSGKSSKAYSKQAYKFKFETDFNQTFFSRPNVKLRSMVSDPTKMREKLFIDMLNSAGVPTQQGAWVRLFVNNEAYGLYLMVDDIGKSFLKQTVHGGDGKVVRGSLVQMNAHNENEATLEYVGPLSSDYAQNTAYHEKYLGNNTLDDPFKELIWLMKGLLDFDPVLTADPIGYWNNTYLDLDGFLRNMALEYLAGSFDNYWLSASNYFIYKNPTLGPNGKWQWVPTDFDGTFGNGIDSEKMASYKLFCDFTTEGKRPLVQKLIIQNKEINALFEQTLKDLVSTAFKPTALVPRIEAYNKMLSLDVQWDLSLTRKSPGKDRGYTIVDYNSNVYNQTKDMATGLIPWVTRMSEIVSTELNFQIPAGTEDRVPPSKGSHDNPMEKEKKDDEPGPEGDKGGSNPTPSSSGIKNVFSEMCLLGLLAVATTLMLV